MEVKTKDKKSKVVRVHGHNDIAHSYLILNGNRSIVVDCGSTEMIKRIKKAWEDNGLSGKDIYMIVVTHTHFDHTRGLKQLKDLLPHSKIFVHENESKCLVEGYSKIPPSTASFKMNGYSEEYNRFTPVSPDVVMKKTDRIFDLKCEEFNNLNGRIIWTPGHISGSVCILIDDELLCGDTIEGFHFSCFVSFAEDLPLLMKSWKSMLEIENVRNLQPGHGSTQSIDILKKDYQSYSQIYEKI